MAVVIPEGYAQGTFVLRHTNLARDANAVMGFSIGAELNPAAVVGALFGAWATNLMPGMDNAVTFLRVDARVRPTGVDVPISVTSVDTPVAGGSVVASAPPNVASLARKTTAVGGRANRGRIYLPWSVNETDIDEAGLQSVAATASIQSRLNLFQDDIQSAPVPMEIVILHDDELVQTTRVKIPVSPGPPTVVVSFVAERLVATQRRRLR